MAWNSRMIATACCLFALAGVRTVSAQAPSIGAAAPQAVRPGETLDVKLSGGALNGATQLWTSFPCEAVLSPDVANNGQNAAEVVYRIKTPVDAPVGVHGIRVATPGGISPLKLFVVDDLPSVASAGNNTALTSAQSLTLPAAVDGAIPALGFHYYKFAVEAGKRLSFEVISRRMGSPLDPIIRLLDANGREIMYDDDAPGLSGDSRLSHTFAEGGEYFLELRDIRYQGGGGHVYRLRIGDFPCVTTPYPLAAKRGSEVTVSFAGPDVADLEPVTLKVPSDPLLSWLNVGAKRAGGNCSGFSSIAVSDTDEFLETEPNNAADGANRVTLGAGLNGRLEQDRDVDRFVFAATKDQKFTFSAVTRDQGSPSDLVIQILGPDGAKIGESDDAGTQDAVLTQAFPADGDYTLVVSDLVGRGGSDQAYRVQVAPATPGFDLSTSADSVNVPAGGTAQITVNAVRREYGGPIEVAAIDLPAGITSVPTVIGPGLNSIVLTLNAAADAPTSKVNPMRFVGSAQIGDAKVQSTATVSTAIKAQANAMPFAPNVLAEASAVGVGPKPQFALRIEPSEVFFARKTNVKAKIIVERTDGFDAEIKLAVTPDKGGLPGEVTVAGGPIAAGQNEAEVTFTAGEKAPIGLFTAVLLATHTKDNANVVQVVPGVRFQVDDAMSIKSDTSGTKLARGGEVKVKIALTHGRSVGQQISLGLIEAPAGVTMEAAQAAPDAKEVEVVIRAAADAAQGKPEKLAIRATTKIGETDVTADAPLDITVE